MDEDIKSEIESPKLNKETKFQINYDENDSFENEFNKMDDPQDEVNEIDDDFGEFEFEENQEKSILYDVDDQFDEDFG